MKNKDHKPVILHVEDDESIALTIAAILGSHAEIVLAQTIEQARKYLNENTYDLMILDLQLPDGSGLDILSLISDEKKIPVIVHSSTEVSETLNNVNAVIHKGYLDPKDLLKTVKELIAQ